MNEEIKKNAEISEEELENVSGGTDYLIPVKPCPACGYIISNPERGKTICSKCGYAF